MNAHPLQKLTCFWSIKDKEDLVLVDHFKIKQSIKIHYYQKDDTQDLQNYLSELGLRDNFVYYLAGPFPFIQAHGDWLLQQGVSPCNLFSDMKKFVN